MEAYKLDMVLLRGYKKFSWPIQLSRERLYCFAIFTELKLLALQQL